MYQTPSGLFVPSIEEQRAAIGLTTPTAEERAYLWGLLDIPSARLFATDGGYRPHPLVARLHNGPWRFVAEGGGLRGGKSLGSAMEGIAWLPHSDLIWLAAETYDLSRQEFDYMSEGAESAGWLESITKPKNKYQPCAFDTPWGTRVETRSLHDLGAGGQGASLVARAPDLIIVCEPGFAPPETLMQSKERLTTRRGRLWMAGTFERANTWYVDIWHKWARWPNEEMGKSLSVPSWLNTASFPLGKNDPEIEQIKRGYDSLRDFLVRWGGVPMVSDALVMGEYWNAKKHVIVSAVFQPWNREGLKMPVYLAVDPGYNGKKSSYAVLAIQHIGETWVVVDEVSTKTLVHEEVIDVCRTREWWPHVASGVIDPYAGTSHVYGARSPLEVWWSYGRVTLHAAPRYEVEDAIGTLQSMLRDPGNGRTKIIFNPACERLQWEMEHWKRMSTREGLGKPSDVNCDAIKAMAYYACAKYTVNGLQGGMPGGTSITVHDWQVNAGPLQKGESRADRYRDYPVRQGVDRYPN